MEIPTYGKPPERVADTEASTGATVVYAVALHGGTAAALATFTNTGGDELLRVVAPFTDVDASAAATVFMDFSNLGGIPFPDGCTVALSGTGALLDVWADKAFA